MNLEMPLTDRQEDVIRFIAEYMYLENHPPTIKEIQEGIDVGNPGSIYGTLSELEDKEYIWRKEKHKARNIRLTQTGKKFFPKETEQRK